jgi:Domain of unknown function (DUF4249)
MFFSMLSLSCVRRITPPIRQGAAMIVVEGLVTTGAPPYTIKLSYTGKFTNSDLYIDSSQNFINDAKVVIGDDQGDSTFCLLVSPGTYQSTDTNFVGTVNRSYTLKIHLSNGKTYLSTIERINPVPPIDSVTAAYDSSFINDVRPTQFIVSVHSRDPISQKNYYRWTATGYVPRKSYGFTYPPNPSPCPDPFSCLYLSECEELLPNNEINVLSDQLINGNEIVLPVFYSPIYWFGNHYIQVDQYSINQDLFVFWQQYLQQTNLTGSILDPLPASLLGNIYDPADSNDLALGYFEASDISSKKIVIIPYFLQEYYLESVAGEFILKGDCDLAYPNAIQDNTGPAGWEPADTIGIH